MLSVQYTYKPTDVYKTKGSSNSKHRVQYNYCLSQMTLDLRMENNLHLPPLDWLKLPGEMDK